MGKFKDFIEDLERVGFHEIGHYIFAVKIDEENTSTPNLYYDSQLRGWIGVVKWDTSVITETADRYRIAVAGFLTEARGMGKNQIDIDPGKLNEMAETIESSLPDTIEEDSLEGFQVDVFLNGKVDPEPAACSFADFSWLEQKSNYDKNTCYQALKAASEFLNSTEGWQTVEALRFKI